MNKSKIFYFCFLLVFLILIIWRYCAIELKYKNYELREYNDSGEEITLIGTVVKEPDVRENSIKLTIEVTETRSLLGSRDRVSAKLLVTVSRYPEYQYGDELKIIGQLQTPPVFEDFSYKDYLKRQGVYAVIYWPEVELLARVKSRGPTSTFYAWVLEFKNKLRQSIYQNLPAVQSYILGAMILGDKNRMPEDLKEKLNITGIRHITAVSGLHIVLISSTLMSLLLILGFWRQQAFYISIAGIALFVALTGFQVSSIRAAIMASFFLLGQKVGRKSVSFRALLMAAGVMLVVNPLLIWDVGFQLSFLAALGIISLAPFFRKWLRSNILAMTFSAYFFTLPILIYNFGSVSLVAPLTNILILPFAQWIMISGFIFGLVGMIFQPLGLILSFPCWFLLTYLIKVTDFFSQFSWASKTIENISWLWLIIFYLILAIFVYWLKKRERLKFLKY